MAIVAAASKIPWKQLVVLTPDIARAAKSLWKQWASKPAPGPVDTGASIDTQIADISRRLQALESNEAAQSQVVSEIADQLQGIANGLEETAARLKEATARQSLVMGLALGASAVSLCALAVALWA